MYTEYENDNSLIRVDPEYENDNPLIRVDPVDPADPPVVEVSYLRTIKIKIVIDEHATTALMSDKGIEKTDGNVYVYADKKYS